MTRHTGKPRRPDGESGLVLLDVVFAILFLGIAALYLVESRSNAIRRSGNTHNLRIARMLATKKIEEFLANEVAAEPDASFSSEGTFEEEKYPAFSFAIYEENESISTSDDLEDPERREWTVRKITVVVRYSGDLGREEEFTLTTICPEILEEEQSG
jgi:Tfp pilus assembly protein PilV